VLAHLAPHPINHFDKLLPGTSRIRP